LNNTGIATSNSPSREILRLNSSILGLFFPVSGTSSKELHFLVQRSSGALEQLNSKHSRQLSAYHLKS
jgi:hypothetical protein